MRRAAFAFLAIAATLVPGCARAPKPVVPLSVSAPVSGSVTHTVQRGQTLYRIAKMYDVEVKEIMRANRVWDPSRLEVGQRLVIPWKQEAEPPSRLRPSAAGGMSPEAVSRVVGPRRFSSAWRTITVHHSATRQGGAKSFDRDHRRRRMGGLFYHFVIGNGTQTGDGEIERGFRWTRQIKANRPLDIQVCLVGDFSRQEVSQAQFDSLVSLITLLREQYGIPLSNVRRHEDIKGKHTQCPGRYFPFHRLLSKLAETGGR